VNKSFISFLKFFVLLFISILFCNKTYCQNDDYAWWVQKHNWDGVSGYSKYMTTTPAYMGPNALPVPQIKSGLINNKLEFELSLENHFSKGDNTSDLFAKLSVPLAKIVTVETYLVPIEYYKLDTLTRDERAARDYNCEGIAGGDFYFGTIIQIVKDHEKIPNIALGINFKTASGTTHRNARYTDAPGYFFDLSFGKVYKKNKTDINLYGMIGFYSWQIYRGDYSQNDAFLFGAGIDLSFKNIIFSNSCGGYAGYIGNGDKPLVYRCNIGTENKKFNYKLKYQLGLNDFNYQTLAFSVIFNVSLKNKFGKKSS